MRGSKQANFRKRVKVWLIHRNMTVTQLAQQLGRRRDTVSSAIHSDRFPRVRRAIEEAIG